MCFREYGDIQIRFAPTDEVSWFLDAIEAEEPLPSLSPPVLEADVDIKETFCSEEETPTSPRGDVVKKEQIHHMDYSGSTTTQSAGAANFIVLDPHDEDYATDLVLFKYRMHCSQEIVVSYGDNPTTLQRHSTLKVTELSKGLFEKLLSHANVVKLTKKPLKESIVKFFETNDITKKRCLVKCSNKIHGLALFQIQNSLSESPDKKENNRFSNAQRTDRAASKILVKEFKRKYGISSPAPTGEEIAIKSGISFDVYGRFGFLVYSSGRMEVEHVVFYDSSDDQDCGELYYVRGKYLDAFGKPVTPKKKKTVKRLVKIGKY